MGGRRSIHGQRAAILRRFLERHDGDRVPLAAMAATAGCTVRHARRLLRQLNVAVVAAEHGPTARAYHVPRTFAAATDPGHMRFCPPSTPPSSIKSILSPPAAVESAAVDALVAVWNTTATRCPAVTRTSPSQRRELTRAVRAHPLAWWAQTCAVVNGSAFLTGKNQREWQATLGWLVRPGKAEAVRAGRYWRSGEPFRLERRPPLRAATTARVDEKQEPWPQHLPEPLARTVERLRRHFIAAAAAVADAPPRGAAPAPVSTAA